MVDSELRDYIHGLLKQGYDIDTIKNHLIKAGHDINKIESLAFSVFKIFHKDLFQYIESELKKGNDINKIKNDLLSLGHSDEKIKQVLHYHKKDKTLLEKLNLSETLHREKIWFSFWVRTVSILLISIIFIFAVLALIFYEPNVEDELITQDNLQICQLMFSNKSNNLIEEQSFNALCRAFVDKDISRCDILPNNSDSCKDAYYFYRFFKESDRKLCSKIKNPNLMEFCLQLNEKNCDNYYGFGSHCEAITTNSPLPCEKGTSTRLPLIGNCRDEYYLNYAIVNNYPESCKKISSIYIKNLCEVIV